jgi:ribonuclease HI
MATGAGQTNRAPSRAEQVSIYTDGGLLSSNPSSLGFTWAWCRVEAGVRVAEASGWVRASELPPRPETGIREATGNVAEFYAVLMAFEALADGEIVTVFTDSEITIKRWAEVGALHGIPISWRQRMNHCLARHGGSFWHHLDGHPSKADLERGHKENGDAVSEHNVYVDALCRQAGRIGLLTLGSEQDHGKPFSGGRLD